MLGFDVKNNDGDNRAMSLLSYAWQSSQTDFKHAYSFLAENELWTLVIIPPSAIFALTVGLLYVHTDKLPAV